MNKTILFIESYEPLAELFADELPDYFKDQDLEWDTGVHRSMAALRYLIADELLKPACIVVHCEENPVHELNDLKIKHQLTTPIVILTTMSPKSLISSTVEGELAGENIHFLGMPFHIKDLVAKIKELVADSMPVQSEP
ncbi:MAG: hypothetical protein AAB383_05145 [Patescibacteria group bacterium]